MVHRIRLKAGWRVLPRGHEETLWQRVFHSPTGLEKGTCVWLVIEVIPELRWLRLNENLLFEKTEPATEKSETRLRLPIRAYLWEEKNLLEVMFLPDPQFGKRRSRESPTSPRQVIPVEVYLEIEETNLDQCDDVKFAIS
ncbi:MAG: hypothetical protein ACUVQG_14525 [Thermogutta sp.]